MSTILTMPKLEMSMTEGTLVEWSVPDGSPVSEGDVIYLVETGKATREIEAPASGTLVHKAEAGEEYEVGTVVGEIM